MKIAFISTRGIPNNYGGFEQFAEYISVGLVRRGHEVVVYSPHFHPYREPDYKGVRIKHIYSPEKWMGSSVGSFFYDFLSLRDALKKEKFDIIYEAGYTSIVPAYIWFNVKRIKYPLFTTNMDGLEYKRTKFNKWVQKFVFWEERMAVKHSHYLIADNMGIRDYYKEKYGKESKFLAYGADVHEDYDVDVLKEYGLEAGGYFIVVARLEPENNLFMAIEGYLASNQYGKHPLVVVGKTNTPLLEAMASGCFILAHDNIFNRAVLGENALYYGSTDAATEMLDGIDQAVSAHKKEYTERNLEVIRRDYSWEKLVDEHEEYFKWMLSQRKGG